MRISSLEIFGFKSFKDRLYIKFNSELIGVVGPNGCGKSNIIDALRWVLGETQAKQLRGGVLEDLIFSGSDARKPMGMAQVSVTFQVEPGWTPALGGPVDADEQQIIRAMHESIAPESDLSDSTHSDSPHPEPAVSESVDAEPHDEAHPQITAESVENNAVSGSIFYSAGLFECSELQITRRLYRSGESEYFINKVACRLKDVVDLCRTIGVGPRGLNIVQQGTIGELITRKPVERRELIEEAAGIAGFRARIETALRQLERTKQNSERLRELSEEVAKQLRQLKKQAARAKTRAELKERLSRLEKQVLVLRFGQIESLKLAGVEQNAQLNQEHTLVVEELASAQKEHSLFESRLSTLDREIETTRGKRSELRRILAEHREKEHHLEVDFTKSEAGLKTLLQSLSQTTERINQLGGELEARERNIEQIGVAVAALLTEKSVAEDELKVRQRENEQRGDDSFHSRVYDEHSAEITRLTAEQERLPAVTEAERKARTELSECQQGLATVQRQVQAIEISRASLEAETTSLERQLASLAQHVTKNFSDQVGASNSKVLLAYMKVPAGIEKAVSAIVAEKASFLFSENSWAMLSDYSRKKPNKPVRLGVIDATFRASEKVDAAALQSADVRAIAPAAQALLNAIEVKEECANIFAELLGGVVLVDTLAEGNELREYYNKHQIAFTAIITLAGEVIYPWGWFTTEGEGAGLNLALRLEVQAKKLESVRAELGTLTPQLKATRDNIAVLSRAVSDLEKERQSITQGQRRLSQLLQVVREAERRERSQLLELERQAQNKVRMLGEKIANHNGKLEQEVRNKEAAIAERFNVLQREERIKRQIETAKLEVEELRHKYITAKDALKTDGEFSQLQSSLVELDQSLRGFEDERARSKDTQNKLGQRIESLRMRKDALLGKISQLSVQLERYSVEEQFLAENWSKSQQLELELAIREGEALLVSYQQGRGNMVRGNDSSSLNRVDETSPETSPDRNCADDTRASIDSDAHIKAQIIRSLVSEGEPLRRFQREEQEVIQALERNGEVDPDVLIRYEEEQIRHDQMLIQLRDLDKACVILDKTIKHLKDISKVRFLKTFQFVSEKFAELIPRLFGGGMGKMELTNPDDPLMTGVELTLRPPGKQLKSLELLSGGEKALAAVAILIAMFLHRPGPICVMDEVDAPLDDANLGKFMDLIREISDKTQFLIITHNKQTMACVDRLIGITMQEKGVSTALEVRLEEAESEIDKWVANV